MQTAVISFWLTLNGPTAINAINVTTTIHLAGICLTASDAANAAMKNQLLHIPYFIIHAFPLQKRFI